MFNWLFALLDWYISYFSALVESRISKRDFSTKRMPRTVVLLDSRSVDILILFKEQHLPLT